MKTSAKYNFCTLFDSYYLAKGLALYYSLEKHCSTFHLYIFAFDDKSYNYLFSLNLKNATIIGLNQFEDPELLKVKPNRTIAEYCWTSTSSTILYCLTNFDIENCTYLDADLYFLNSPNIIFEEIGDSSIALTKHNYHYLYDQSKTNGLYCVQFMYFKNDEVAIKALKWWRNKCIDWCFNYLEDGRFGDQGYLPELISSFPETTIIKNEGAGMAPWNLLRYKLLANNKFSSKYSDKVSDLIFYHFHFLHYRIVKNAIIANPGKVFFTKEIIKNIYYPYVKILFDIEYAYSSDCQLQPKNAKIHIENYSLILKLIVIVRVALKKNYIIRHLFIDKSVNIFRK